MLQIAACLPRSPPFSKTGVSYRWAGNIPEVFGYDLPVRIHLAPGFGFPAIRAREAFIMLRMMVLHLQRHQKSSFPFF